MSGVPFTTISSSLIDRLVLALESLTDGELAVDMLIASGERAIAPLEELLLQGKARTIAVPRCRAVRALGGLEARGTLLAYFEKCELPADPVVLFNEIAEVSPSPIATLASRLPTAPSRTAEPSMDGDFKHILSIKPAVVSPQVGKVRRHAGLVILEFFAEPRSQQPLLSSDSNLRACDIQRNRQQQKRPLREQQTSSQHNEE